MEWRDIPSYEGLYQVSESGEIKTVKTGRIRKQRQNRNGYMNVMLCKKGEAKQIRVHRAVMMAFCPVQNSDSLQVNHKNGIKTDNRLENLEWCTASQNILHRIYVLGLLPDFGTPAAKPVLGYRGKTKEVIRLKSAAEGKEYGFSPSSIASCCRRKIKKHRGVVWRYLEECPNFR